MERGRKRKEREVGIQGLRRQKEKLGKKGGIFWKEGRPVLNLTFGQSDFGRFF